MNTIIVTASVFRHVYVILSGRFYQVWTHKGWGKMAEIFQTIDSKFIALYETSI